MPSRNATGWQSQPLAKARIDASAKPMAAVPSKASQTRKLSRASKASSSSATPASSGHSARRMGDQAGLSAAQAGRIRVLKGRPLALAAQQVPQDQAQHREEQDQDHPQRFLAVAAAAFYDLDDGEDVEDQDQEAKDVHVVS
jgi:hypothetical protein